MESFFARVGRVWPAGRRDLHWHILPTAAEARALAAPYKGLAPRGLAGVSVEWMHCTLVHAVGLGIGDVDTDALLEEVGGYARLVEPFTLTFDRPSVGAVAVEISGWPGRQFTEIVDAVTQATARSTEAAFKSAPSRYPHMSLAYTSHGAEDVDAVTLRAALADIDQPLSGTVRVDRLHLVEQWHDGAHITWRLAAEVPLGGRPAD
ncbi:2'-5' RNA ligase family protein [Streptomyces sp. NPDC088270]|uniref:2'-5' RNA ligase family protein n=1 Tax=Streptomyces sp. NPDC088270 TaxID=3160990 RepID=UPI003440B888